MGKAQRARKRLKEQFFLVSPRGAPEVALGPAQGPGFLYTPRIQFLPFAGSDKYGKERGQIVLTRELWNRWFAERGVELWDECDTFDKLIKWLIAKGYRFGCPVCNAEFTNRAEQLKHIRGHQQALSGLSEEEGEAV